MKVNFIVIVLFCSIGLLGRSNAQDDSEFRAAQEALNADDLTIARKHFEAAYKSSPSDTAVVLGLAETYLRMQDVARAEDFMTKALKVHEGLAPLYLKLGIALNMRAKFKKAEENFQRADELMSADDPLRQTLYINYGIALVGKEQVTDAIVWFDKVLAINPRNATAYNYKGAALYKIGEYDDALRALNLSLDIDLQNPITLYNRGMTYMKLEERSKGCLDFHAACKKGNMNACKQIVMLCKQK
ncbi:MAG: tetratricopeptide repeat protein [Bacteroides sp.]